MINHALRSGTAAAVLAVFMTSGVSPAQAGCRINLAVVNNGNLTVVIIKRASKVKIEGGLWRRLSRGGWRAPTLPPGQSATDVYNAAFGCTALRRYRIEYKCMGVAGTRVTYYPGPNDYNRSSSPTIRLDRCN